MTEKSNSNHSKFHAKPFPEVYVESVEELAVPFPSFDTGYWKGFDEKVGGFRSREFSILCAPTGVGKTQWLASLSALFLKQQVRHFVASVETGPHDFIKRVMSVFAGFDFNTGNAVPVKDLKDFDAKYGAFFKNDIGMLSLHDNRLSLDELLSHLETAASMGYRVAILDNLNFFLDMVTAANSLLEMDRVIHELIMLCKRIDIHILMVMHPKKTDDGRVTSEFDIKGSSTAVQEAHNVFLLNRPSDAEIQSGRKFSDRVLTFKKLRRRGIYVGQECWFKYQGGRYEEIV